MVIHALRDTPAAVRYARSRETAIESARLNPPAVVVTAFEIDGAAVGPAIARACRRQHGSAVVFIAGQLSDRHLHTVAAMEGGAFLCKPVRLEQLHVTLRVLLQRALLAREHVASPDRRSSELARALRQIAAVVNSTGLLEIDRQDARPSDSTLALLRPREQEVVRLLFEHVRVPGIARQLGISPQTVRNHLKRIFQRLGVHSQQELIARLQSPHHVDAAAAPVDEGAGMPTGDWESRRRESLPSPVHDAGF